MSGTDRVFLDSVCGIVRKHDADAMLFLYGPRALGQAGQGSAWDILIVTSVRMSLARERAMRGDLYSLELESGEVITAGIRQRRDWIGKRSRVTPFHRHVVSEGVLL